MKPQVKKPLPTHAGPTRKFDTTSLINETTEALSTFFGESGHCAILGSDTRTEIILVHPGNISCSIMNPKCNKQPNFIHSR